MKLNIFSMNYILSNAILLIFMFLDQEAYISIFIMSLPTYYFIYIVFSVKHVIGNFKRKNKPIFKYILLMPLGALTNFILINYLISDYRVTDRHAQNKIHEFSFCEERNCIYFKYIELKNTFTKRYRIVISEDCIRIESMSYSLTKVSNKLGCMS